MAARFVNIDRNTPLLLPVDMMDWVPKNDPARLIVDLVEEIDLRAARVNQSGSGSRQFPPSMMLALLLHSYVHGVFSSREIETNTYLHVGVRYITGDTHPDHDTICKFRRENGELIKHSFTQSLALARELGILQLGTVAMDGSKLKGNAATEKSLKVEEIDSQIETLDKEAAELQCTVDGLLEQAEQTDSKEEKEKNPEVPPELEKNEKTFKEKLKKARIEIQKKEQRRARLEAARAHFATLKETQAAQRETMREEIRAHGIGWIPDKLSTDLKPSDRVNVTDPDALNMKSRGSYFAGYNAQAAADCEGSGLLLAAYVTQERNDRHQLEGNVRELENNLGEGAVDYVLGDTGYDNTHQIHKIESKGGPTMICLQQTRSKAQKPKEAPRGQRMRTQQQRNAYYERLKEPANKKRRRLRRETIEPSFGIIKEQMGFTRFSLRGAEKVDHEWRLVAMAFNLRKLNRNQKWVEKLS